MRLSFTKHSLVLLLNWANDTEQVIQDGYNIACKYGLAEMDALHIAAAILTIKDGDFVLSRIGTIGKSSYYVYGR